jgi:hypothetical protein
VLGKKVPVGIGDSGRERRELLGSETVPHVFVQQCGSCSKKVEVVQVKGSEVLVLV